MKKILLAILFVFTGIHLFAQRIEFEEFDLDNGLHVILHQDNSNPIIVVSVLYHVGSKNENPDRTGFAHFFEHLMFEGSENIERGEFDMYVTSRGGSNNAHTTNDYTYYYELFPSNQLALGLWLESERMLHAKVDQIGIDTQREVVKEEKRLRVDNTPYMKAFFEDIPKQLFKKHPYRWSVIGSMEHLNASKENDYKNFYKTFYVPNNATLSIAGDIDMKEAKKMVIGYFADIPRGKDIPRVNTKENPITEEIFSTSYDKNVQIPAVGLAYRVPKLTDDDSYVLNIISDVLSNGESSRFSKSIVNDKQLAIASGAFLEKLEDYGSFICYGIVNQNVRLETLTDAMDEEIEKLRTHGISKRELQKQINQLERNYLQSNASMAGVAENLAYYHVFYGDANFINSELEIYKKITVEDVKRVANRYLKNNQRVRVHIVAAN